MRHTVSASSDAVTVPSAAAQASAAPGYDAPPRRVSDALARCQDPGLRLATEPSFLRRACPGGAETVPAAWLAVAVSHKSWLYENGREDGPNGALLSAFAQLGNDVLALELLAYLDGAEPDAGLARRHEVLSQRARVLDRLASLLDLDSAARLGAGEEAQSGTARAAGRAPPAYGAVAAQCLAWWSLFGDEGALRRLVADAAGSALADDDYSHIDAKTLAEQALRGRGLTYECAASGPAHQQTFQARAVLADGRAGHGTGPSKRAATKAAALDLLLAHAPDALAVAKPRQDPSLNARRSRRAASRDADRYLDIARAFGCDAPDDFALALTHRSWTYEQDSRADLDAGSNTLLAHGGRQAFDVVLNRIRVTDLLAGKIAPDADEAILGSLADDAMAPLLTAAGAEPLVRVGQGQRQLGLQTELAAGCVQALFGAAFAQHRSVRGLERSLPDNVLRALADLVGIDPLDHATRLHRELAPLGLVLTERSSAVSGPAHRTTYESVLVAQGRPGTAELRGRGTGKRQARKAAAAIGLRGLAALGGDPSPVEPSDRPVTGLLLKAQAAALGANERQWARWLASGRLGSRHLADGDAPAFWGWADQALDILGGWRPADGDLEALARFFAFARSAEDRPVFAQTLGEALDLVHRLAAADALDPKGLQETREAVRALTAAHAVRLADGPAVRVANVVEEFGLLAKRAVDVAVVGAASALVSAPAAAAASRLLHEAAGLVQQPGARPRAAVAMSDTADGCEVAVTATAPWAGRLLSSRLASLVKRPSPKSPCDRPGAASSWRSAGPRPTTGCTQRPDRAGRTPTTRSSHGSSTTSRISSPRRPRPVSATRRRAPRAWRTSSPRAATSTSPATSRPACARLGSISGTTSSPAWWRSTRSCASTAGSCSGRSPPPSTSRRLARRRARPPPSPRRPSPRSWTTWSRTPPRP